jgi:hypothetical protein
MIMILKMHEIGNGKVLAGAVQGQQALRRLLEAASPEPAQPEPLFLDFSQIEVATASYLRESVLAFRDLVRGRRSTFYPVGANVNGAVRDELLELMKSRGGVLMTCRLDESGQVSDPAPIGELDPKQKMTFELVRKLRNTDARELMRDYGKTEGVRRSTAWNNRLSSLAALGLVIEESQGRAKRYRALFEGM